MTPSIMRGSAFRSIARVTDYRRAARISGCTTRANDKDEHDNDKEARDAARPEHRKHSRRHQLDAGRLRARLAFSDRPAAKARKLPMNPNSRPWRDLHKRLILGIAAVFLLMHQAWAQSPHIDREKGVNPWNHLQFKNTADDFQFAMISDLTGRERPGVIQNAVRKLNLLQPEFVVSIGDLIEGHTNDAAQLNRDWDAFFESIRPLEMPMFYVPGNHDYWYRTTQNAQAGEEEVYDMAAVYKERVGRSYYHFVYRNVLFLILNNTMGDQAEIEEEKRFITRTLQEHADVRWTFTFFHYAEAFTGRLDTQIWKHLVSQLGDRPFTAFGGNSHQYVRYERNGRDAINLATTGGMSRLRGARYGEFDHLVWITMTDAGPKIANVMLDGIHDKNIRTEKSAALMSALLGRPPIRSENVLASDAAFKRAATRLQLSNAANIPLQVQGVF
jgi:hypothetical protein